MLQTEVYQADKRTLRMRKWHRTRKLMRKNWVLYLFLLPAVLYIGVFHYAPMYGVQTRRSRTFRPLWACGEVHMSA